MLKILLSVKALETQAAKALEKLLAGIPAIKIKTLKVESPERDSVADIVASIDVSGQPHVLLCEVKANGQPRNVRNAVYQLMNYVAKVGKPATPILIAPYLSPASRDICVANDVSYLDLEGNARLVFDNVFVERVISNKPASEKRGFKSLFKPKSAQVLRALLRDPHRIWRVKELAEVAGVSLGHVSNVRTALLDREWAQVVPEGLSLTTPDALLDAWKSAYEPPIGIQFRFYTTLHGVAFEKAVRKTFGSLLSGDAAVLASFSAANWIAPYARTGSEFIYAGEEALERIKEGLSLSLSLKGENVTVILPKDQGLFRDVIEPVPGIYCTSPVQTYLDLCASGERGQEAAEHLRKARLIWQK
jgi:hypothetical protein